MFKPHAKVFSGARLRAARESKGLTRFKVHEMSGGRIQPPALYNWERGKAVPSINTVLYLVALLGIKMSEVIEDAKG